MVILIAGAHDVLGQFGRKRDVENCTISKIPKTDEGLQRAASTEINSVQNKSGNNSCKNIRIPCKVCGKIIETIKALEDHYLSHSYQVEMYTCYVCHKSFKYSCNLTRHIKIHNDRKEYKCIICNKAFGRKDHLVRHMRLHTEEKYQCDLCDKSFKRKEQLLTHEINYHLH